MYWCWTGISSHSVIAHFGGAREDVSRRIFNASTSTFRHNRFLTQNTMSYGEAQERPAKKRRFFVDDVDEPALNPEPSLPDEIQALPVPHGSTTTPNGDPDGPPASFEAESLKAIIGEKLSAADIQRLRDLSGGNLEQGRSECFNLGKRC
jgi:hypothetical protein